MIFFFLIKILSYIAILVSSAIHLLHNTYNKKKQHTTVIDKGIFNPTSSCGSKAIDIRKIKGNNNKKKIIMYYTDY